MSARAAGVGMGALVLATALASCQSGVGMGPAVIPTSSASVSESPSVAGETFAPTPSGRPSSGGPTQSVVSEGVVTIITLVVADGLVQGSGIIPDIVESGGECTLTISRGGIVRGESVAASSGRESTYCGLVTIATDGLESGTWDAVLSYRSLTTEGESAPTKVQVP